MFQNLLFDHVALVLLLLNATLGFQAGKPPARPLSDGKVASVFRGRLVVQPLTGGAARPATEGEKALWRTRRAEKAWSFTTKDGKYRAEPAPVPGQESDEVKESLRVVKVSNGKLLISPEMLSERYNVFGSGNWAVFCGWLPNSRVAVIGVGTHIAGLNTSTRYCLDAESSIPVRFSGWASPGGRIGIIPNKEGPLGITDTRNEREVNGKIQRYWEQTPMTYYTAALPQDIRGYQLAAARRKRITMNGKPYEFPHDALREPEAIRFSSDERFALYNGYHNAVLIDMKTGIARQLSGNEAAFLP